MGHGMRQIQEERFVAVGLDKGHRFFGIPTGESVLVSGSLDLVLIPHKRHEPVTRLGIEVRRAIFHFGWQVPVHVVRIWNTEPRIEAVTRRQILRSVSEMPLADDAGCVPQFSECFGDSDLARREAS